MTSMYGTTLISALSLRFVRRPITCMAVASKPISTTTRKTRLNHGGHGEHAEEQGQKTDRSLDDAVYQAATHAAKYASSFSVFSVYSVVQSFALT
jgi:hypothetical protein